MATMTVSLPDPLFHWIRQGNGHRRHEHKSHVILYEPTDDGVLILAVVHGRSVRRLKL